MIQRSHKRYCSLLAIGGLMFLSTAGAKAQSPGRGEAPEVLNADGRGNYVRHLPPRAGTGAVTTGNGINYNGGPVMRSGVNVYYIWYGDWTQDPGANAILTDFARSVGGSPYYAINTTYGDSQGGVQNLVSYSGSTSDSGSLGTSLSDSSIWSLVNNALASKALPVDPNGVYFVLTAPYVAETSGFLTKYCGWHTHGTYGSTSIKYSFVGNPIANLGACSVQGTSPNGDAPADAMVSVVAHELAEAATDPQLNAWYDSTWAENADKCAWNFGSTYTVANGSRANMQLGLRDFLIQQNWLNSGGGACALSYKAVPDFSISVSPNSQSILAGGTTGTYTATAIALNGWSGTVSYSVTAGLPVGAAATVAGTNIVISTTTSVVPGTYQFTVTGADGTSTHTTTAILVVGAPDFSLSVSPVSQTIPAGGTTGSYTLSVTAINGWTGTVTYTGTTGLPLGASANISGNVVTFSTTTDVVPGTYNIAILGTDGTLSHSVTATLVVASPNYSISFTPSSLNVTKPSDSSSVATAVYTITVTPIGGFNGTVTLSTGGSMTGVALSLSSATVTGGGTVTLTASVRSTAKKGNRTLTVTGVTSGLSRSASGSLRIN